MRFESAQGSEDKEIRVFRYVESEKIRPGGREERPDAESCAAAGRGGCSGGARGAQGAIKVVEAANDKSTKLGLESRRGGGYQSGRLR